MSKSNWKELPDWKNSDDYAFLDGAENAEWAWEFLRRNEDYREHWHQRELLRATYEYHPPMKEGETEQQWMQRTVHETDSDPIKQRKDLVIANKWGLECLHDPEQPFSHEVRFIMPGGDFPRFIAKPEDLDPFFEVAELADMDFQRVVGRYSIVVFDNARHPTPQLKIVEQELQRIRDFLLQMRVIKKAEKPSGKKQKWKKHLCVLDARRLSPPAPYHEIARLLTGDAAYPALNKRGKKYMQSARTVMDRGYKGILAYKGTPYT